MKVSSVSRISVSLGILSAIMAPTGAWAHHGGGGGGGFSGGGGGFSSHVSSPAPSYSSHVSSPAPSYSSHTSVTTSPAPSISTHTTTSPTISTTPRYTPYAPGNSSITTHNETHFETHTNTNSGNVSGTFGGVTFGHHGESNVTLPKTESPVITNNKVTAPTTTTAPTTVTKPSAPVTINNNTTINNNSGNISGNLSGRFGNTQFGNNHGGNVTLPSNGNVARDPRPTVQVGNGGNVATTTPAKNGGYWQNRGNTTELHRADGSLEEVRKNGVTKVYRKDGQLAQVRNSGGTVSFHDDGSKTVVPRHGLQYTERTVSNGWFGGKTTTRTYTINNTTYVRNYNTYYRGSRVYYSYVPRVVFAPSYYSWVLSPYRFSYTWAWLTAPWYAPLAYYYHPYPYYAAPAYWLTDWLIADYLSASYAAEANANAEAARDQAADAQADAEEARMEAQQAEQDAAEARAEVNRLRAEQGTPISDDVKEQLKRQVDQSVQAVQQKAPVQIDQALSDLNHIYPVSQETDATVTGTDPSAAPQSCGLTEGDLIRLAQPVAQGAEVAEMIVVTSKKGDCPAGVRIQMAVSDLQEMNNDFTARVETGMGKMQQEVPHN